MAEGYVGPIERDLLNRLAARRAAQEEHTVPDAAPPEPVEARRPLYRRATERAGRIAHAAFLRSIDPGERLDVQAIRERIRAEATAYLQDPSPGYALVLQAEAGVGKTYAGLQIAHWAAAEMGLTTAYAMPRHEHALTLRRAAQELGLPARMLFHWLPAQGPGGVDGIETCLHPLSRQEYQRRGYDAIHFCAGVCGWDYVKSGCAWHGQKQAVVDQGATVVCVQHQHVFLGHPLSGQTGLLVIDENALGAMGGPWRIPGGAVVPQRLRLSERMGRICGVLAELCRRGEAVMGRALIDALADALGGHQALVDACAAVPDPDDPAADVAWTVRSPEQVHLADHHFVPVLAALLRPEAQAALEGKPVAGRVRVVPEVTAAGVRGMLDLYWRPRVAWRAPGAPAGTLGWPPHAIVFDATPGRTDRYCALLLQRPVRVVRLAARQHLRVFQVHDRANTMGQLFAPAEADEVGNPHRTTERFDKTISVVRYVAASYRRDGQRVGIISYKRAVETGQFDDLVDATPETGEPMLGHFGAERGTNRFRSADCLIVVGLPQPGPTAVEDLGLLLIPQGVRDAPFREGGSIPRTFEEHGFNWVDPLSGRGRYIVRPEYADPDLKEIGYQTCDAEVIQSMGRLRAVLADPEHPKHLWLVHNRPIDEIRVDYLLTAGDLHDTPPGISPQHWPTVRRLAEEKWAGVHALTTADVVGALGCSRTTANAYVAACLGHMLRPDGRPMWAEPSDGDLALLPSMSRLGRRGTLPIFAVPIPMTEEGE